MKATRRIPRKEVRREIDALKLEHPNLQLVKMEPFSSDPRIARMQAENELKELGVIPNARLTLNQASRLKEAIQHILIGLESNSSRISASSVSRNTVLLRKERAKRLRQRLNDLNKEMN